MGVRTSKFGFRSTCDRDPVESRIRLFRFTHSLACLFALVDCALPDWMLPKKGRYAIASEETEREPKLRASHSSAFDLSQYAGNTNRVGDAALAA